MTEAQKRDAYLEAQQILRLDKTWQQVMPGERKPNFKRAAREIIRRALGHKVTPLRMHGGLMHQHEPREAALIERTLKSGMHDPSILHSFQLGSKLERHDRPREHSPNRTTPTMCPTSRCSSTTTGPPSTTRATLSRGPAPTTAACTRPPSTPRWR